MPNNIIPMGRIVGAFGILGWVKIKVDTQEDDSLSKYSKLLLFIDGSWIPYKVEKFFVKANVFHVKFDKVANRDEAIALRGILVGINRNDFPKLPDDEYYWTDLIGLTVYNQAQELLGTVENLMETGANSVLVIKNGDKQHLVPFVNHYIISVDEKQIIVDWGLDY